MEMGDGELDLDGRHGDIDVSGRPLTCFQLSDNVSNVADRGAFTRRFDRALFDDVFSACSPADPDYFAIVPRISAALRAIDLDVEQTGHGDEVSLGEGQSPFSEKMPRTPFSAPNIMGSALAQEGVVTLTMSGFSLSIISR